MKGDDESMKRSPVERLLALVNDVSTRRTLTRGLAGLTAISVLELLGVDEADARRKKRKNKKKNKNKKKRNRRGGGAVDAPPGGDPPNGNNPSVPPTSPPPVASPPPASPPPPPPPVCEGTICEEECVDTDTDDNNCGACGNTCDELFFCCGGTCRFRLNDDNLNCGGCGRTCTGGDRCCFGRCIGRFEVCG